MKNTSIRSKALEFRATSRAYSALLTMLVLSIGSACSGGSSDSDGPAPSPAPRAELRPDELLIADNGVAVGAPVDALAAPVTLLVEATTMPATALPDGIEAVGGAWRIGATARTRPTPGTQFTVGLKRPDGEDAANLEIALLLPAASTLDGSGVDTWAFLKTNYNATHDLLYTGALILLPEGSVYVLIRRPSPARPAALSKPAVGGAPGPVLLRETTSDGSFVEARCGPEFILSPVPCGPTETGQVEREFVELYDTLISLGYPFPRVFRDAIFVTDALTGHVTQYLAYIVDLRPCHGMVGQLGAYSLDHEIVQVCVEPPVSPGTTRHELFHAFQASFPATQDAWVAGSEPSAWVIEATASAAEYSDGGTLRRTGYRDPRRTLRGLYADDHTVEYRSQDFWVYLGQRLGGGLDLFLPFLQGGPLPAQVDATFAAGIGDPELPDLASAYFAWAKNQSFEAEVELPNGSAGPAIEGGTCQHQLFLVDNGGGGFIEEPLALDGSIGDGKAYDPDAAPPWASGVGAHFAEGKLTWDNPIVPSALRAEVVQIELTAPRDYAARVFVDTPDERLRYKVYEVENSSSGGCISDPDDEPKFFEVKQGSAREVAVLLAWTGLEDPQASVPHSLVVERVGLYLTPEFATHAVAPGRPVTDRFRITNGTSMPVTYTAQASGWLQVTQGQSGTIPANDAVEVEYTVTCAIPNGSAEGDIALAFANGAPLAGPEVPTRFRVAQTCTESDACLDPARHRGTHVTATLGWSDSGSVEVTSQLLLSESINNGANVETTRYFAYNVGGEYFPETSDSNGLARILHERTTTTTTPTDTFTTSTTWSGSGEAFDSSRSDAGPPYVSASQNPVTCMWNLRIGPVYVDAESTIVASNGSVTTSNARRSVVSGSVSLYEVSASGSRSIAVTCNEVGDRWNPACYGNVYGVVPSTYLRFGASYPRDDSELPPVDVYWSITPILE